VSVIGVTREGRVAVVVIDNPPVNASSHAVREALLDAIAQTDADAEVTAVVLTGAGKAFMGGADIREFDKPPIEPQLPQVIAALMDSPKPWLAAIHGPALGGGFELALGCDVRIAAADAIVGLPEVTLGIMPGAGGTQHLPRIVGVPRAIELICAARRLTAEEALQLHLIDEVVRGDLRATALSLAVQMTTKHRVRDLPVPHYKPEEAVAAEEAALAAGFGRQVVEAIAAIKSAAALPYAQAMKLERRVFLELRASPEAAEARRRFFESRNAAKGGPR
jgi:3-hydroxyacyl-CoA dehydrogenase